MIKITIFTFCLVIVSGAFSNMSSANEKKVGIFYDARFLLHDTGPNHPENPERLISVIRDLKNNDHISSNTIWPNFEAATVEELNLAHTKEYIELVDRQISQLKNSRAYLSTGDTPISKHTNLVAKLAVGAGLEAADQIMAGNISTAFALVRPPGHHATASMGMGFCVYNSVAVVARYLQKKYGLKQILIVDFDVHHGNGTQEIFYNDNSIAYASSHEFPLFPGTGSEDETGVGNIFNAPIKSGTKGIEFHKIFESKILKPLNKFKPEVILISAGFDAHFRDPLANINLESKDYFKITKKIVELANTHAKGRIISFFEGGYNLQALSESIKEHLMALKN